MAENLPDKKLHSFSKQERLCNFTFKKLLFQEGEQFSQYPLRIYWKIIDKNLEDIFFSGSVTQFSENAGSRTSPFVQQNPSYPHKKVPSNALFTSPVQCLTGASGKVHKTAALRNQLKRLIREAYRQNKHEFYSFLEQVDGFCLLGIVYTGTTVLKYPELENKIIVSLQKLQQKIKEQTR